MRSLVSTSMKKLSAATLAAGSTLMLGGCLEKGFLDPTELGAFNKEPLVVPVLDNLSTGIEEPAQIFGQAVEPTAADLVAEVGDYTIAPNDQLQVTISDLRGIGLDDGKVARVTDSGRISLPNIGQIFVAGMTEAQAEEAISKAYRDAAIIQNAQVSVVVVEARGRLFSITGAVGRPGQYQILKTDFRLLDAFVASADFDVTRGTRGYEYVFVIRRVTPGAAATPAVNPVNEPPADILKPRGAAEPSDEIKQATYLRTQPAEQPVTPPADAPATSPTGSGEGRYVIIDGKPVLVGGGPAEGAAPAETTPAMPLTPADPTPAPVETAALPASDTTQPFEFNAPQEPTDVRIIRIPMTRLVQGELRYNIVIRPGDTIFVPNPLEGVYYMGGHVSRPGVYTLGNGNKVSLMDAIIAAGNLDPLAVPWRTQVIRRIQGQDKQIFATVDLTKIFNGEEPDLYLKKDDKIIVGSQWWAPFLASIRNGFRITYGFGFLYDRNYAPDNNNN